LILEELFDQDVSFMHRSKGPFSFCQYCEWGAQLVEVEIRYEGIG
jgi:hypothetical protein